MERFALESHHRALRAIEGHGTRPLAEPPLGSIQLLRRFCELVLLGDSGVGKTSLVRRIVFGKFEHDSQPTQSVGFMSKKIEVPSLAMSIKFEIWDTAG